MLSSSELPQANYQIRIYDTDGVSQGVITDWQSLDYERRLNDFDLYTLILDYADPRRVYFVTDAIVEIWRRPPGSEWYRDATCLHITPRIEYTELDRHLFTSYGRGLLDLLHRRSIRYTNALASKTGPGETVIYDYVDQNAGPNALMSAGRSKDGVTQGLVLPAAAGTNGSDWTGDRSYRNLLDTIQEIAAATGVDFELTRQGTEGTVFTFRTAYPQLGSDLSSTVVFATNYGNLLAPSYTNSRTEEINSVAALGAGRGAARSVYVLDDDSRIVESPWNLREGSANGGNTASVSSLISSAQEALAKGQPQESFDGQIIQTENYQYGVQYDLGDLVTLRIDDIERVKKITYVHVNVAKGKETVDINWSDYGRI